MKAIFCAFALMAMVILPACRRSEVSVPTPEPSKLAVASPTVTLRPLTSTPTLEPTSTVTVVPTQPPPLTKDLIQVGSTLTISIQGQSPIIVMPEPYNDESTKLFSNWKDGIALVNPRDVYGNMVIDIHSGYDPDGCRKLPAEDLRVFIQGKEGCGALASNSTDIEDQLIAGLTGLPVTITQEGKDNFWFIGSVQRVEHQDAKQFRFDTYQVVDSLIELSKKAGTNSSFLIGKHTHGLIAIISLRAFQGSTIEGEDPWSYEVLVIGFYPKQ